MDASDDETHFKKLLMSTWRLHFELCVHLKFFLNLCLALVEYLCIVICFNYFLIHGPCSGVTGQ